MERVKKRKTKYDIRICVNSRNNHRLSHELFTPKRQFDIPAFRHGKGSDTCPKFSRVQSKELKTMNTHFICWPRDGKEHDAWCAFLSIASSFKGCVQFIGGYKDGQWESELHCPRVKVPIPTTTGEGFCIQEYTKLELRSTDGEHVFYVLQGMTLEDVMKSVFGRYEQKEIK